MTKTTTRETTAEQRLNALRERMKKAGLVGGGTNYLSIDVAGGYLIGTYKVTTERKGKKYKNMEQHHEIEVSEGFGRTKDTEKDGGEVKAGTYDVRAGGQVDAWLDKNGIKAGDEIGILFKGKSEPSKEFKQGVKSYELYKLPASK